MRVLAYASIVACCFAQPCFAQQDDSEDVDFIFSQPGLSREQVGNDWEECRDLASMVTPPASPYTYTPNAAAAAANGFISGFIRGAQRRHMRIAALRKCMAVKGYARLAVTKEEGRSVYAGKWAVMREHLIDEALALQGNRRRLDP